MARRTKTEQDEAAEARAAAEKKVADAQAAADADGAGEDEAKALDEARAELAALPPAPAAVRPQQYATGQGFNVGDRAPEPRYGVYDSQGNVKPTPNGGKTEPKAGERGSIIIARGDVVTQAQRDLLGL